MSKPLLASDRPFHGRLARTALIILLVLSTIPLLLMGATAYWRTRVLLRDQVFSLFTSVTEAQTKRLTAEIETGQLLLSRAATGENLNAAIQQALAAPNRSDASFLEARQVILNELQGINNPRPFFNKFLFVSPEGEIRLASSRQWEGKTLATDSLPIPNGRTPVSRAVFDLQPIYPGSFTLLTTLPFQDRSGNTLGTLIGVAESPTVRDLMERSSFYSQSSYFVTREGQFLGVNPYPNSFEKLVPLQPAAEQQSVILQGFDSAAKQGTLEILSFGNQPVIASYRWLPRLEIGWVSEIPQAQVYSQLNSLLQFGLALFGVTFLLMGVMVWGTTRRMVQPILSLTDIVQGFAQGNWDQRAPEGRQDEVGLLAASFNHMADELRDHYRSLEAKVEERTTQIHIASEGAEITTTATNLDELLKRTVNLLASRFGYPQVEAYLLEGRQTVDSSLPLVGVLRQTSGQDSASHPSRLPLDSASLLGRAAQSNQAQVEGEAAAIPIAIGEQVLALFFVQALPSQPIALESVEALQTLANQLAPALQNFYLLEATQVNLQETTLLYQASHQIAHAEDVETIFKVAQRALQQTPYYSAFLLPEREGMKLIPLSLTLAPEVQLPQGFSFSASELQTTLQASTPRVLTLEAGSTDLPESFLEIGQTLQITQAAFLPVLRGQKLVGLLVLGIHSNENNGSSSLFSNFALQPYINLAELIVTTVEKVEALENTRKRLEELQTLYELSQTISVETEMEALYQSIHQQVNQVMGTVDFLIALYDADTHLIQIPYMMEHGQALYIAPFPLGEGMTSILIQTGKPLLIVENAEQRSQELGAKAVGAEIKSWLGVPMILGGQVTGAIVVQDTEQENRFTEDDQRLLSTLAAQVAVAVRNARLLESSRRQAERERSLNEITAKIRRSSDIQSILNTTVDELSKVLNPRRAQIEIRAETEAQPTPESQVKAL